MNTCRRVDRTVIASAILLFCCRASLSQTPDCNQIGALAKMVRAKSPETLAEQKKRAGADYRAKIVFAVRLLELRPNEQEAAASLLDVIPQNDNQQTAWMTIGDSLCDAESMADITSLGQIRDRLPRALAKAALVAHEMPPAYVAYAIMSTQDPHSDYALQMEKVCRIKHQQFVKSLDGLPDEKRSWFASHILNPERCRALALPEAK
jgi:hypothetical protein